MIFSGRGGIEIEAKTEISPDFDLFFIYLTELLDVVDEMEKSAKKEN
ncbi:hypothetical protein HDF18_05975 [Mucilaginibacter sp. X5P1]|nr:hypothetical protein [Mucilaginibacter sp. X5P1]MBB6137179.1 hypothetical protein [Mucilaginibacter sp. X5P1]